MTKTPRLMWFRQDLRIADNPALHAACADGAPVIPIFILDDAHAGEWKRGAASRWWLHHSLTSLNASLGGNLRVFRGKADEVIPRIMQDTDARAIYWNRAYEPWRIARDTAIKATLTERAIDAHSFQASVLFEPHTIAKDDGTPYRVFTPFYKKGCLKAPAPREPLPRPDSMHLQPYAGADDVALEALELLPDIAWDGGLHKAWEISEDAAHDRLAEFLNTALATYKDERNRPDLDGTSRLSPYLHHGEISPNQMWYAAKHAIAAQGCEKGGEHFLSEIGWREFGYYLLYHFPDFPTVNFQPKFDGFTWQKNHEALRAWQHGKTGYPIVDAGMRQLWETGWMHNRVRMIVGSFLIKDLLIDWREGERWFWDTLVDADLANNSAGWQWVAGSGADASPYFRIFNPITQSQKFDPHGDYIRRFVPELAKLDNTNIHAPWEADEMKLADAGIVLGKHYPHPMVDHAQARDEALARFKALSA